MHYAAGGGRTEEKKTYPTHTHNTCLARTKERPSEQGDQEEVIAAVPNDVTGKLAVFYVLSLHVDHPVVRARVSLMP